MAPTSPSSPRDVVGVRHVTPPSQVHVGERALHTLGRELDRTGAGAVALVCTKSLTGHEKAFARVKDAVGDRVVATFDSVQRYSPIEVVVDLRDVLARTSADAVVVLGGGSAIVTARAASVLAGEGRPLSELATFRDDRGRVRNPDKPRPKLPQWIVPSTPTVAYAKAGAALRDTSTGRRVAVFDPKVRAQGVFVDPAVIATAPVSLVRSAALNGLSMAVEGLLATGADPMAEALLAQGLREIVAHLPHVTDDGADGFARSRVMMGSLLAGQGSDFAGGGLALALAHTLSPLANRASGVVEAVCLAHTLRFTAEAVPERVATVAAGLGLADLAVEAVVDRLRSLLTALDLPVRLRDLGVDELRLGEAAGLAAEDWAITGRIARQADAEQLAEIVREAW